MSYADLPEWMLRLYIKRGNLQRHKGLKMIEERDIWHVRGITHGYLDVDPDTLTHKQLLERIEDMRKEADIKRLYMESLNKLSGTHDLEVFAHNSRIIQPMKVNAMSMLEAERDRKNSSVKQRSKAGKRSGRKRRASAAFNHEEWEQEHDLILGIEGDLGASEIARRIHANHEDEEGYPAAGTIRNHLNKYRKKKT